MEIPKYIYPGWLTRIMDSGGDEKKLANIFPEGTILKLKNLETNEENEYTLREAVRPNYYYESADPHIPYGTADFRILQVFRWEIPLTHGQQGIENLVVTFNIIKSALMFNEKGSLNIKKNSLSLTRVILASPIPYGVILDINPTWISGLRLAFAMSLNERLGEHSLLKDTPYDIINCIVDKIQGVVLEETPPAERILTNIEIDFQGEAAEAQRRKEEAQRRAAEEEAQRRKEEAQRRAAAEDRYNKIKDRYLTNKENVSIEDRMEMGILKSTYNFEGGGKKKKRKSKKKRKTKKRKSKRKKHKTKRRKY